MKQEIGREEERQRTTDHWLPAGIGIGSAGGRFVPPARLLRGQLLPLAQKVRRHERLGRQATEGVGDGERTPQTAVDGRSDRERGGERSLEKKW